MKIKMLTLSAGPDGVIQPGQVVDLGKEQAQALIDGGYAVSAEKPVKQSAPAEVEEATDEPTSRTAGKRQGRK